MTCLGAWPVWTLGAPLAGFIKGSTIHCYTQNMKALGHVVSEKKIFSCILHYGGSSLTNEKDHHYFLNRFVCVGEFFDG